MITRDRFVCAVALLAGAVTLGAGLWAFVAPHSFYVSIATFPPYNRHFLHDVGAFQIGLGACLLLATFWTDALSVVLAGFGVGAAAHALAHILDRDLGGRSSDPYSLGALALLTILAAVLRATRKEKHL